MSSKQDEPEAKWRSLVLLFLAVVATQAALGTIFSMLGEWNVRGLFGDMFGAVNTLFSGLAFAGVIYAILLQKQELQLQRRELELTRLELERSAEAQQASADLLSQQLKVMKLTYAPAFHNSGIEFADDGIIVKLSNQGGSVRNLTVDSPVGTKVYVHPTDVVHHRQELRVFLQTKEQPEGEVPFLLHYTTSYNEREHKLLEYRHDLKRVIEHDPKRAAANPGPQADG